MAVIVRPNSYSAGQTILSAAVNSDFNTIYADYNGNITNANIASNAAIVDTKLAQITTAGKVSILALTVASQATGDIIYASSASAWARLAVGSATTVLHGGTIPAFSALVAADMLAGSVVQTVFAPLITASTGTTAIPYDDSPPLSGEGDEVLTQAFTPLSATNKLKLTVIMYLSNNTGVARIAALYQDATSASLAAGLAINGGDEPIPVVFTHYMTSGTTSSTTFKVRVGGPSGTTTWNGASGARKLGAVLTSSLLIEEIKV